MTKVKQKSNFKGIIFLASIIVITLFLLIFTFISIGKPFVIKDISDIKHVTVENYKTFDKKHEDYYVYVYNSNNVKCDDLESTILEYANYVRTNSEAVPIYVLDYNKNPDIINSSNLNYSSTDKLPTLITICNGSKESTKNTVSTIKTELFDQMGK